MVLHDSLGMVAVDESHYDSRVVGRKWSFVRSDTTVRQVSRVILAEVLCDDVVTDSVHLCLGPLNVEARAYKGQPDSGDVGIGRWQAQRELLVRLKGYDAHGWLPVVGFTVRRIREGSRDRVWARPGATYRDREGLMEEVRPGDRYEFSNVRYRSLTGYGILEATPPPPVVIADDQ